jgi:hypothetical protein
MNELLVFCVGMGVIMHFTTFDICRWTERILLQFFRLCNSINDDSRRYCLFSYAMSSGRGSSEEMECSDGHGMELSASWRRPLHIYLPHIRRPSACLLFHNSFTRLLSHFTDYSPNSPPSSLHLSLETPHFTNHQSTSHPPPITMKAGSYPSTPRRGAVTHVQKKHSG